MQKKKMSGKALVIQLTARELRVARMTLGTAMPQIVKSAVVPLPELRFCGAAGVRRGS